MPFTPPDQGPVSGIRSLRVDSVEGYWEIYDGDMNLVTDRDYACFDTDTIRGCITITVHDSVPTEPAFMRSAVMAFQMNYTFPNPDDDGESTAFVGVAPGFYECALNDPGRNKLTICGPFMGVNGSIFYHGPLLVGSYCTWITATDHFLFNIDLILPWTSGDCQAVVECPPATPNLRTIPMPSNPKGGDLIHDTAILENGVDPTGEINFKLWADPAETMLIFEQNVGVEGNGTYRTDDVGPIDEDIPFPEGIHWHWHAHYSGDGNNAEADSGSEPVNISPETGSPSGSDQFTFAFAATIFIDDVEARRYPAVTRFVQSDLSQLWVHNTRDVVLYNLENEDKSPVGPSLPGHLAVGGQHRITEVLLQTGAHVYNIPNVDHLGRDMDYVMGVAYNWKIGDLYAAITPDPLMPYTPHDVDWFRDDTGILAAVVPGPGQLVFRKYDYAGNQIDEWTGIAVEPGWYQQPVKAALDCAAERVFYTFQGKLVKVYNLATRSQEPDYLTLPAYVGYLYGDLQLIRGAEDNTSLVITMTQVGQGPHRGVALAPSGKVWNDRGHPIDGIPKVEKRKLGNLHLELAVTPGDGDEVISLACYYDPCVNVIPRLGFTTVIG